MLKNAHESGENYLETILILHERNSEVRSIDIATEMGFSRPSVSRAVKLLKNDDCIDVDDSGRITLTKKGDALAKKVYDRHKKLTRFLVSIGVKEDVAAMDACRMEHILSEQSFRKIMEHCEKALSAG